MAQLAIKGHATRGSEVIALLEMLGGKNTYNSLGVFGNRIYTIDEKTDEIIDVSKNRYSDYNIFSLEEFLEKFPYKVRDEVIAYAEGCFAHFTVQDIRWNNKLNKIEYKICSSWCDTSLMQPYKEETMKTITIDDFKANTKEWLIDKLYGMIISDAVKTIGNIHDELHKSKYPKTYEECCEVLNTHLSNVTRPIGWKENLISKFQELIICRDAYWKIAGDEMELGEPWKPDWNNVCDKYTIYTVYGNEIWRDKGQTINTLLAFPTKEMRDAFYENFKDLIETCKELL